MKTRDFRWLKLGKYSVAHFDFRNVTGFSARWSEDCLSDSLMPTTDVTDFPCVKR